MEQSSAQDAKHYQKEHAGNVVRLQKEINEFAGFMAPEAQAQKQ
jgi:hypothetical protein